MADEVISVQENFYILSTSPRIDDRTRVLKHGDTFAVFDRFGDVEAIGTGELGIYYKDTRFVSRLSLRLEGKRPLLLSSTIQDDNAALAVDAMNPDIQADGAVTIPRGTVHLLRSKFLWKGTCYERIRVHNYGREAVSLRLTVGLDADFADIFEMRGVRRERRGGRSPAQVEKEALLYTYEGLDARVRRTRITFAPRPTGLTGSEAGYDVHLLAGEEAEYGYAISCELDA